MKKEIEDLKATVKLLYDDNVICGVTAKKFDLAIAALEKQIPKKLMFMQFMKKMKKNICVNVE